MSPKTITPSRLKYERENPIISLRMNHQLRAALEASRKERGLSWSGLALESLGEHPASLVRIAKQGFIRGYAKAEHDYRFSMPCTECGEPLVIKGDELKQYVVQLLQYCAFTHPECTQGKIPIVLGLGQGSEEQFVPHINGKPFTSEMAEERLEKIREEWRRNPSIFGDHLKQS